MHKETVTELVSGYAAYADAGEFDVDATSAAPALKSSVVCLAPIPMPLTVIISC